MAGTTHRTTGAGMGTDKLLSETQGAVGHLIFNNPQRHNAVSLDMWEATERALDGFRQDDAVRVVVLSGAGEQAFVAGADISRFASERASAAQVERYNVVTGRVLAVLHELPKPTVAMIDGYCIGGGLALAVACDLRFCSERSSFGLPAARLGVGYSFDGLRSLVEVVGVGAARDIAFSARRFGADEARDMGLVNKVLPPGELRGFVVRYAEQVAENAPLTVKAMKLTINQVLTDPERRDPDLCRRLIDECAASADYAEGRRAFMEKREPRFLGR